MDNIEISNIFLYKNEDEVIYALNEKMSKIIKETELQDNCN